MVRNTCDIAAEDVDWIAVEELNLSYYIGKAILISTIYTHYGNLV